MNLGIAGCIVLVPVSYSCLEDDEHPPPTINLQNSWKNSTAHCCDPLTKALIIWGKQESNAVGRTTPDDVW